MNMLFMFCFFFFNDTATTEIYTLSLHDALPIFYGMPESNLEDNKEELLADFRKLKKVYADRVELKKEDITHMTRIGIKNNSKTRPRSEEHTSELQSLVNLVCRLLLEKKKQKQQKKKQKTDRPTYVRLTYHSAQ